MVYIKCNVVVTNKYISHEILAQFGASRMKNIFGILKFYLFIINISIT